jgi:hypothetical protein
MWIEIGKKKKKENFYEIFATNITFHDDYEMMMMQPQESVCGVH